MDWIVKCRYVKDKDTNKLKREIIRICPKCKDERKITRMNHKSKDERIIDVSKIYDYECPVCGQIMEREGYVTDWEGKND